MSSLIPIRLRKMMAKQTTHEAGSVLSVVLIVCIHIRALKFDTGHKAYARCQYSPTLETLRDGCTPALGSNAVGFLPLSS
jgi:hypothetical protein|eukprot:COSAG03_NODE_734_length_6051_cov_2.406250_4_plen_80_part_00